MVWHVIKKKYRPQHTLLRDHEEELHNFVQAVLHKEPDVEQRLARSLQNKPEYVRWVFLNQLRERVHDEKEALSHVLEPILKRQEETIIAERQQRVKKWIAYMLPAFNRVRTKAAFSDNAVLKEQLLQLGHEMEEEGICNPNRADIADLGDLDANHQSAVDRDHHKDHDLP